MDYIFVLIGAAISLIGAAFYIIDTLRGKTQPNRVSWLMWTIAPFIAAAAALSKGGGWVVLPVFMVGFVSLLTFLSSFVNPRAYWKLSTSDYICGVLSLLALVLWAITQDANIAITFAILSDLAAAIPTLTKAWSHPESESGSAYIGGLLNSLSTFFAVKAWTFSEIGFSTWNVLFTLVILYFIYRTRFGTKKTRKR